MVDELFKQLTTHIERSNQINLYSKLHQIIDFKKGTFPGTHNVTFLRSHFNNLCNSDYLAAEKTDGKRCLLYFLYKEKKSYFFFIDRTIEIFKIKNTKSEKINAKNLKNSNTVFLVDGELTEEEDGSSKFILFDSLIYNDMNTCNNNLIERLDFASKFISHTKDMVPFKMEIKRMYKCYGFYELYVNRNELSHDNDGIVFTPVYEPYTIGVNYSWFKWKPANLNTVDFYMVRYEGNMYKMHLSKNNESVFYDYYVYEGDEDISNKICEFLWDNALETIDLSDFSYKKGNWKLFKVRPDKSQSNSVRIAKNIFFSIEENIQFKDLEEKYWDIRNSWKEREKK